MSDESGNFPQEERDQAKKWLESQQAGGALCPTCRNNEWTMGDKLIFLATAHNVLGQMTVPGVLLACTRCGFIRIHSAVMMGLIGKKAEEKAKAKDAANG